MDVDGLAGCFNERDGQLPAEVLAELVEAVEQGVGVVHRGVVEVKAKGAERMADVFCGIGIKHPHQFAVGHVEGKAQCDTLAVLDGEVGELFKLMPGPVSEVQRPGGRHFKRVAAEGNVVQMQVCRTLDDVVGQGRIALPQHVGTLADQTVEPGVFQQAHLDRFAQPAAPLAVVECVQQGEVIYDGPWHGEGTNEVLLAEHVHAVLHTDARVGLCERGGGHADQADATVSGRGREADHIEHRTAADHEDVAVSIDVVFVDLAEECFEVAEVVLALLAAGHGTEADQFG